MADNTTLNAGTGGDVIASDDIGGVKFQRIKLIHGADGVNAGDVAEGNGLPTLSHGGAVSSWPGYSGATNTAERSITVDDFGALVTRGAVLTDEGTFRCNFANTSLWVGIGSVTVSGNTVLGTGFLASDVHYSDYFKIAADADSAAVQIASVDSDTQITLETTYGGSTSGTGNRALLQPFTGTGGSLSVASGALTITAGTTATSITGVKRFTDYGPLVFRARASVSQRIANQEIHIGLEEDAATTRWFARFLLDGTTNTTVKCETGRNPSGAPSASETQTTTATLPNGATTATSRDYRVELLTESVRFYVDGVLLAEHSNTIPSQHDEMTSHVEVRNGTTPASSTTVTVDYITGKNHNKLEVGVMSEAERIVSAVAPLVPFTYSVAGVIAINTDLLVIDCSQFRSLFIQCNSMGTTGVVTVQWSNEPTFAQPITATLLSESGATSTTFNAAVLRVTNVMARYCRLRLTTATTTGTTTLNCWGAQCQYIPAITTQPVSGTVTANIGTGALAAGTSAIGDVGVQYRANATGAASGVNILSPATPAVQTIKAAAGRLLSITATNTNAAARFIKIWNTASGSITLGTTAALYEIAIPPNQTVQFVMEGGIGFATAINMAVTGGQGLTNNAAVTLGDVTGIVAFA